MVLTDKLRRAGTLAVAAILFATSLMSLQVLQPKKVGAYGLLGSRSITISTSQISAVNTTYHVRFDVNSATKNVGGVVVEFCDSSPIIGDTTCSAISGFDINAGTVSGQSDNSGTDPLDAVADDCDLSTFTSNTALTSHTLSLTAATPVTLTTGNTCFFDITTVTNPSTANHTFYARIYTFSEAAEATGYTFANPNAGTGTVNDEMPDAAGNTGNDDVFIDAGGIALSTAQQITITSKVQERLTFCVYGADASGYANNDCLLKTSTGAIALGDVNGVLDPGGPYVDKAARYTITTNAASNAIIRAKGGTLTSGGFTVDPIGGGTAETDATDTGNIEQFGLCTYQSAGSNLTIDGDYNGDNGGGNNCSDTVQTSGGACTGIINTNSCTTPNAVNAVTFAFLTSELTSTFGSNIATAAPGAYSTGTLAFLGNIDNTTQAGIYTTTLTFIATGTY